MTNRRLVHIQIVALVVLTLLVLSRVVGSERVSDGFISFEEIEAFDLKRAAFVAEELVDVRIVATGSLERRSDSDTSLAAYAWILDHESKRPVWVMSRSNVQRGSGMMVHADTTISLEPGTYEVFFSSFGNHTSARHSRSLLRRLFDDSQHWITDERNWSLSVQSDRVDAAITEISVAELDQARREQPLFASGPIRSGDRVEDYFRVEQPTRVRIYAVGSPVEQTKTAWIRRPAVDVDVWTMSEANTIHAGGAPENRFFSGELTLDGGIYGVGFHSEGSHAWDSWRGNPPFDVAGWGMELHLVDPADRQSVTPFDPWTMMRPVVRMAPVGNDEHRQARIRVVQPVDVALYAVGEIGRSRYDFGSLRAVDASEPVWEMSRERSVPAGGHDNNRKEIAFFSLDAGDYALEYRTDGSHAAGDWRNGEPEHPERWGLSLLTLQDTDSSFIEVLQPEKENDTAVADESTEMPADATEHRNDGALVDLRPVTNDQRRQARFDLERTSDVHVEAVGEITLSNRYDYGWIEDAESGRILWEMTYGNTTAAGGDSRNRRFDGVIKLPPGSYVAIYQSDFSHAYGDFRSQEEEPDDPRAWGMIIRQPDR